MEGCSLDEATWVKFSLNLAENPPYRDCAHAYGRGYTINCLSALRRSLLVDDLASTLPLIQNLYTIDGSNHGLFTAFISTFTVHDGVFDIANGFAR